VLGEAQRPPVLCKGLQMPLATGVEATHMVLAGSYAGDFHCGARIANVRVTDG